MPYQIYHHHTGTDANQKGGGILISPRNATAARINSLSFLRVSMRQSWIPCPREFQAHSITWFAKQNMMKNKEVQCFWIYNKLFCKFTWNIRGKEKTPAHSHVCNRSEDFRACYMVLHNHLFTVILRMPSDGYMITTYHIYKTEPRLCQVKIGCI